MLTFSKTSHGPAKSMTTALSDSRKATGMLPSAGGSSGLGNPCCDLALLILGSAAVSPMMVDKRKRSRLFIMCPWIVALAGNEIASVPSGWHGHEPLGCSVL